MAKEEDVLLKPKTDRRILPNVPDPHRRRTAWDRRALKQGKTNRGRTAFEQAVDSETGGRRYMVDYKVKASANGSSWNTLAVDISCSGILLYVPEGAREAWEKAGELRLDFRVEPGSMFEGMEMRIKQRARVVRFFMHTELDENGCERLDEQGAPVKKLVCGLEFATNLVEYANRHRGRYLLPVTGFLLAFIVLVVILMRVESVVYFRFNKTLYFYSLVAATFLLSRYFFGALYRPVPVDEKFTPGVSILVPCFNEKEWIVKTIVGCANQYYPPDKLEVIVIDDCSTDGSQEEIKNGIALVRDADPLHDPSRFSYVLRKFNSGKREVLAHAAGLARHELLVFVDSDSFLDPFAIINLVQPFRDSKVGGVSGRTDVANTYTNVLTKMQSVRYYIAFRIMKACEGYFDAVTCLSGPLACYRKDLVMKYRDDWINQKFMRRRATFGDDRSMTNFILRNYRTDYQDTAVCYTIVPNGYSTFLRQQMRWKRSWLRESLIAGGYMFKKEPFAAAFFYMGLIVPILAPVIVLYNLIYIPLAHRVFPTAFIIGMVMMAGLMSVTQLLLRKSTTWIFGVWFCLYYEGVLLWQMPYAWVTFWKSTWGTRETPADVLAKGGHVEAETSPESLLADYANPLHAQYVKAEIAGGVPDDKRVNPIIPEEAFAKLALAQAAAERGEARLAKQDEARAAEKQNSLVTEAAKLAAQAEADLAAMQTQLKLAEARQRVLQARLRLAEAEARLHKMSRGEVPGTSPDITEAERKES